MENVYKIRKEKELYYILSEKLSYNVKHDLLKQTAVIVYLYYEDIAERHFLFLDNLPMYVSIYIVSSNEKIFDKMAAYVHKKKKRNPIYTIKKENRGRDVSALLVACREIIIKYQYICFIHDKKKKHERHLLDTQSWIDNLWGNCLITEQYIENVLHLFEEKKEIGLLVPPEPIGEYFNSWFADSWGEDFENTKRLAEKLQLNCHISPFYPPITLGTVFWGRVDALRKLIDFEWCYGDFQEEPLPEDGTFSHAVERILAYVAQDAGYDTGTIMSASYAEKQMNFLQENMTKAFQVLSEELGISNIIEAKGYEEKKEHILTFAERNQKLYLYGAGEKGAICLRILRMYGYYPSGYIVTKKNMKDTVNGLPVTEWKNMNDIDDIGIIVTVGNKIKHEIIQNLLDRGFENYIFFEV